MTLMKIDAWYLQIRIKYLKWWRDNFQSIFKQIETSKVLHNFPISFIFFLQDVYYKFNITYVTYFFIEEWFYMSKVLFEFRGNFDYVVIFILKNIFLDIFFWIFSRFYSENVLQSMSLWINFANFPFFLEIGSGDNHWRSSIVPEIYFPKYHKIPFVNDWIPPMIVTRPYNICKLKNRKWKWKKEKKFLNIPVNINLHYYRTWWS